MSNRRMIFDIVEKAMSLIEKKAADYSEVSDPHSNFKYAALIAAPFPDEFKPYAVLIGVKLSRLAQLLRPDAVVQNEAVEDSFVDCVNYVALMAERHQVDEMKLGRMNVQEVILPAPVTENISERWWASVSPQVVPIQPTGLPDEVVTLQSNRRSEKPDVYCAHCLHDMDMCECKTPAPKEVR